MGWLSKRLGRRGEAPANGPPPPADAPANKPAALPAPEVNWRAAVLQHFDLLDILGSGGHSTVYRARPRAGAKGCFALKVTDIDRLSPWGRQAALREARVLGALSRCSSTNGSGGSGSGGGSSSGGSGDGSDASSPGHPCLPAFREAFCVGSRLCIVTDVAPGGDLRRLLDKRAAARAGGLPEQDVWRILLQVALALQHLHAHRVLHRDVKPHNVLLHPDGRAQLTDMGICGLLAGVFSRKDTGTPQYRAPEMWRGQPYSFSADMWALGCTLFEMCAARPLFDAPPGCTDPAAAVAAVQQQVLQLAIQPPLPAGYSPELGSVLAALLQPSPADRPSAAELLAMPAVAARMGLLPAAVRAHLAAAAAEQPQGRAASGWAASGLANLPWHLCERVINACLPAAAYACGSAGVLDSLAARQHKEQRAGGRSPWRAFARRTSPAPTVATAAGSQGSGTGGSVSASDGSAASAASASLASLDLASPYASALEEGAESPRSTRSASASRRLADRLGGALAATALA